MGDGTLDVDRRTIARTNDPDTSKEAARRTDVNAQALAVLRVYARGRPIMDIEAYELAGLLENSRSGIGARCSDLRDKKFIERTGERGITPSGSSAHKCRITDAGMRYILKVDKDD
jgi:hypothetical protein